MYYKFWFEQNESRPKALIEYEGYYEAVNLTSFILNTGKRLLAVVIPADSRLEALMKLSFVRIKW